MERGNAGDDAAAVWFWLIAGPDGVGRTTYAMRHLRAALGTFHFVNMDEIARGLSPLEPRAADRSAARVALSRARELIRARRTFAMETTLSGQAHHGLVGEAQAAGLQFGLLYFAVGSPEICIARVARRVREGGHAVAETDLRRRFTRSVANFGSYAHRATRWQVFDNTGLAPRTAAEGDRAAVTFLDPEVARALPPGLVIPAAPDAAPPGSSP